MTDGPSWVFDEAGGELINLTFAQRIRIRPAAPPSKGWAVEAVMNDGAVVALTQRGTKAQADAVLADQISFSMHLIRL